MTEISGNGRSKGDVLDLWMGVVGLGTVGGTVAEAFRRVGVELVGYDPYLGVGSAADLGSCAVVSLCVPTPSSSDGSLDVTAVWKAMADVART